jgi:class 3 adenylate cyclase
MARTGQRDAVAAAIIALAAGLATLMPATDIVRGLSIDALTGLQRRLFGPVERLESTSVIVALDEETYRTPPFANTPNIAWTREIGRVLSAIVEGGGKVVGFDIVYPLSIEQSEIPFGDATLGAKLRGFDRDFLRALSQAARADKVVLGQVQLADQPVRPSPGQRIAVGHERNIRALNVHTDPDNVVRRLPLTFMTDGEPIPSMAVELAARALQATPEFAPDGRMTLAGYQLRSAKPDTLTLNFSSGSDGIPIHSLADLRACVEKGDVGFFRREFAEKVVLFGVLLDSEDRKITSRRFAGALPSARTARCALPRPPESPTLAPHSTPGVYVHATAVNNLINRDALAELGPLAAAASAIVFSALMAAVTLALAPIGAVTAYAMGAFGWTALAMAAFRHAFVLPLVEPLLAGLLAMVTTIGYRFVISDRDKRFLRRTFALYLAPPIIDKMVSSKRPPQLGGEMRLVTVFFSDVAGFSTFSERLAPTEVVTLMNAYFSEMGSIIEEHGGFIYQYVGDAMVALFGAPLDDPDHACNAVRAALRCRQRLDEINRSGALFMGHQMRQRIGINSGDVLVGNIGSRRRLSYTAMGDAVNLAARLEGANKFFGTSILASDATFRLTGSAFLWRELDSVRVKGRSAAVNIYEPLAETGQETAEQVSCVDAYAEGLARWRAGEFAEAATVFARFADTDPPFAVLAARAQKFAASPPGPDWDSVNTLDEK